MNPPLGLHLILEIIFIVFYLLYFVCGWQTQANPTNPSWAWRSNFIVALLIGILGFIAFTTPARL